MERAKVARLLDERDRARAEVELLKRELDQAISERTPHDYGILREQRDEAHTEVERLKRELEFERAEVARLLDERDRARAEVTRLNGELKRTMQALARANASTESWPPASVRKEPSRLEIAAMLKAGWFANPEMDLLGDQDNKWWHEQAQELIDAGKELQ